MLQHGLLLQRYRDGTKREHEVVIPPSILENQGAECVLAAVERRRGDVLWPGSPGCSVSVLILGSDSHRALVRLATRWARSGHTTLPADSLRVDRCRMFVHGRRVAHLGFAALATVLSMLDVMSGLFSATVLMHTGQSVQLLHKHVRQLIMAHVSFTYDPGDPADLEKNKFLVRLLGQVDALTIDQYP